MLNAKLKRTTLALVLAVVLMLSLFPVAVLALEDAGAAPEDEAGIVIDASGATNPAESTGDAATDAADAEKEPADTESGAADTTGTADDGHDHDHDHDDEKEEEKKGMTLGDIISLAILGVVIILIVVYCLTHKEKVGKLFSGLKSELKKIVWTPWNQVRKNTLVVLVVIIAAAIVIGVLDLLFHNGIVELGKLF